MGRVRVVRRMIDICVNFCYTPVYRIMKHSVNVSNFLHTPLFPCSFFTPMTIHDRIFVYKAAYKRRKRDVAVAGLLFLATTLSFAAGYIIGQDSRHAPIIIQKCAAE